MQDKITIVPNRAGDLQMGGTVKRTTSVCIITHSLNFAFVETVSKKNFCIRSVKKTHYDGELEKNNYEFYFLMSHESTSRKCKQVFMQNV